MSVNAKYYFSKDFFPHNHSSLSYKNNFTSEETKGRLQGRRRWNLNAETHNRYIYTHVHALYYMDNTEIHAYNKPFHRSQQHNHLLISLGNSNATDKGCLLSHFIIRHAGFMVFQSRGLIIWFIYCSLVLFFTPRCN